MNDPKGGVAKVTCRTFEAMGHIPMFHRTYFLFKYSLRHSFQKKSEEYFEHSCNKFFNACMVGKNYNNMFEFAKVIYKILLFFQDTVF